MTINFRFVEGGLVRIVAFAFVLALTAWTPRLCSGQSNQEAVERRPISPRVPQVTRSDPPPRSRRPWPVPPPIQGFATGTPRFNVKNFGAVCDGHTDDTVAIQNAYNAAAAAMSTPGGAGIVYFPPSTGFCVVGTLRIPNSTDAQGWITTVLDNGLFITDTVYAGTYSAFIGRTSSYGGMSASFMWGPVAMLEKPHWSGVTGAAPVTLAGAHDVYFEGVGFFNGSDQAGTAIDLRNVGLALVTNVNFQHCTIRGGINIAPDAPGSLTGFGLRMVDTALNGNIAVTDFGQITIIGGYMHKMSITNEGIGEISGIGIDGTLSEALNNEDFLTVDSSLGPVSDITLHGVILSDTIGSSYMLKNIHPNADTGRYWLTNVKFDMIPQGASGSGLIDPASEGQLISAYCVGYYCDTVLSQAKDTLYMYYGFTVRSGLVIYGSPYIPNPMTIVH